MNSRRQPRKWDSGFTQTRRRFSATRAPSIRTQKDIKVGEMSVEILTRNASVKYLGQRISFYQQETLEIKSRIRAAWAIFHKYRQELTSKNYMLKHRLRLFDATFSPTLCYAAGTWTPNRDHERMIQSTQRKMLRPLSLSSHLIRQLIADISFHQLRAPRTSWKQLNICPADVVRTLRLNYVPVLQTFG